jgi:hypothetical protein
VSTSLPELVDAIHVALGLGLDAVVLIEPGASGLPRLLVVADEVPDDPGTRLGYLRQRTPVGTLDGVEIQIKTPLEFAADPVRTYRQLASNGRVLLDTSGWVSRRLAEIRDEHA